MKLFKIRKTIFNYPYLIILIIFRLFHFFMEFILTSVNYV